MARNPPPDPDATDICPSSFPPEAREAADAAVADFLSLLGKRHTLALLYRFTSDPRPWRFSELQTELSLSPTTLSERLSDLTGAGLLRREVHDERPARVAYHPTARLLAMRPVFTELYRWMAGTGTLEVPR